MSVGLFRYNKDMMADDSKLIFSANVASETFYTKVWAPAIKDTNTTIFKDGSSFSPKQLNIVLNELTNLMQWCDNNLIGNDHYKMHTTLEELIEKIPLEAPNSNENFYIF